MWVRLPGRRVDDELLTSAIDLSALAEHLDVGDAKRT